MQKYLFPVSARKKQKGKGHFFTIEGAAFLQIGLACPFARNSTFPMPDVLTGSGKSRYTFFIGSFGGQKISIYAGSRSLLGKYPGNKLNSNQKKGIVFVVAGAKTTRRLCA
ncbi:MAG: hypothetical protein II184_01880 [Clostridia bacterium]|nr:hypothetical protein [Clostridia bacterium]MBQ3868700.1 hypothetical protein [Clostridia bacterium]